ncbi:hypothetical protein QLQ12_06975 [Actinoplanes sp. NEAU-A12]|uniref:Tetratricopeptide repeat protein n=1 Tax=Actinoplanes sandaracinus TaxID=3045177 RepID=A0ABT6WF85_9ACTN|nr:hypothetical protein [Actinoplanes sandaracinus]MDI6098343.1 hypothetical protein [Actinoplanes sandaracinus]
MSVKSFRLMGVPEIRPIRHPAASDMTALHQVCERLWRDGGHRDTQAFALLRRCLQRFDPHTAPDDEVLLHAVLLYLPTAVAGEGADLAVMDWGLYAWRTAAAVYGSNHPRTLAAAELLAQVLGHHECAPAAISLYRGLTGHYQRRGRHDEHARIALALADALHDHGACQQAHATAESVLREWRPHHSSRPELGPVLLLHTLRMLDACGRVDEARSTLHTHTSLLPADGVTRDAVAALALILLGCPAAINRHRSRCANTGPEIGRPRPGSRRRSFTQVRRVFLAKLTGDADYGAPQPALAAESLTPEPDEP